MSELARANGWRGFEGIGEPTAGGYEYMCDGMPSPMGCGASVVVTRKFARIGVKKTGWYVCYGMEDDGEPDVDVVLTFCPRCAAVVQAQERRILSTPTEPKGNEG